MKSQKVRQTKSGLITRYDSGLGLLVYSPYSGLIFAVHRSDASRVQAWLDGKQRDPPAPEYELSLGPGWCISRESARYPLVHLLPEPESVWPMLVGPKYPILINWLITGMCPLACRYCYAEDLMRDKNREPNSKDIERIVGSILSYRPLAVVLTGGDPLSSKYLRKAIRLLHGHVGIMVDTSAYGFKPSHLSLFKKYNVVVRISFDSERPRINQFQRPVYRECLTGARGSNGTLDMALKALCDCLESGLTVSAQTVATKKTANDLPALGDKLLRLGLHSWRVLRVQPSVARPDGYEEVAGSRHQRAHLYDHIFRELISCHETHWQGRMGLELIHNETPNAVILVGADGTFYTESNVRPGKVLLDIERPNRPRLSLLYTSVSRHAHAERYLNLTRSRNLARLKKGG